MTGMLLVNLILLLIKACLCTQYHFTPQAQVLSNPNILLKISTFLDNPYRNLALTSSTQWKILHALTPGRILADRLNFPEIGSVITYNSDTRLLLSLDRWHFCNQFMTMFVFQPENSNRPPVNVSPETKRILVYGMFHYIMRGECGVFGHFYLLLRFFVFKELLQYGEFKAAYELSDRFNDLLVPEYITEDSLIIPLLKQSPFFTTKNFLKFRQVHYPALFAYILNENLCLPVLKEALLILLKPPGRLDEEISQKIFKKFELFLRSTGLPASPQSFEVVNFIIEWMRLACRQNFINISFYRDMCLIRFQLNVPIRYENIIYKWANSSVPHLETILCILLRLDSLILSINLVKTCKSVAKYPPQLKDFIQENPKFFDYFDFDTMLFLHANDYNETIQSYCRTAGAMALVRLLETPDRVDKFRILNAIQGKDHSGKPGLSFEQYLNILRDLASTQFNFVLFETRYILFEALVRILSEMQPVLSNHGNVIQLQTEFFLILLESQYNKRISTFDTLKLSQRFGFSWRIEAAALQHIFKPANEHLFQFLMNISAEISPLLAVNFLELVPIADLTTWTDKICPLFRIDYHSQFLSINEEFWPTDMSQFAEIDSVINGNKPVIPYVTSPLAWSILPRLASRSLLQYPRNLDLLRLWARMCMVTFVIHAPKEHILKIINHQAAVMKWIGKRPDNFEFNVYFASVFLDGQFRYEIECRTFDKLKEYMTTISPFLISLKPYIKSSMSLNIYWEDVFSTITNTDQFRELIILTSPHQVINEFEARPELKTKYSTFYQLLYDFDFIFQ